MAEIKVLNESTIKIIADVPDALKMIAEARRDVPRYAHDIITIYEKMPAFEYTFFCFYAYDSAALFEYMLGANPREYTSFSMDAPPAFFYVLYGGMAALYEEAKKSQPQDAVQTG
ncbi:MAG TPA: hypothetical protein VF260_01605 [Bacilli bacterium]